MYIIYILYVIYIGREYSATMHFHFVNATDVDASIAKEKVYNTYYIYIIYNTYNTYYIYLYI